MKHASNNPSYTQISSYLDIMVETEENMNYEEVYSVNISNKFIALYIMIENMSNRTAHSD